MKRIYISCLTGPLHLTRKIIRETQEEGFLGVYVFGYPGSGKTSYALWIAYEVLGDWNLVKKVLTFRPREALELMEKAVRRKKRLKILIMDDAGTWLHAASWYEAEVREFLRYLPMVRTATACIIFTTPHMELPAQVRNFVNYWVEVTRGGTPSSPTLPYDVQNEIGAKAIEIVRTFMYQAKLKLKISVAKGYRLVKVAGKKEPRAVKEFFDIFPTHYPRSVHDWYVERRREYVSRLLDRVLSVIRRKESNLPSDGVSKHRYILYLLATRPTKEVVETIMKEYGVSEATAYRWIAEAREFAKNQLAEFKEGLKNLKDTAQVMARR